MIDRFYRDTYNPHAHVGYDDFMANPSLKAAYERGVKAYAVGVSYQFCREVVGSLEEHAWQRGWDRDYYGDVSSISAFEEKPLRAEVSDD